MSSISTLLRRQNSVRALGFAVIAPVLLAASIVSAQDAIRPSLAGEAAAEARRLSTDRIPYNLLAGPIRFRFSATAGVEYNDNINLADIRNEEDVIFRPQVNLNALWPITQLNTLRFDIGIGYGFYAENSDYNTNSVLLSPGSQLAFDVFVGDFRINFHDRFSLQQDPIDQATISNVVDFGRFENTIGVSVLWDLNKAVITAGYDHYTYISMTDRFEYLDRDAEIFMGTASFAVTSTTGVGIESSYVLTRYDQGRLNDSDGFTLGGFVETAITSYLKVRVAGGWQLMEFDSGFVLGEIFPNLFQTQFRDQSDLDDFYVNLLISHRVNASFSHSIAAGREAQLGINSNYIELMYARHTATWNIINRTLLATELFYEEAEESGGFIVEDVERYGGAISLGYQLTQHVTLGARYQYTLKDSNVRFRDYRQNRFSLDGTYSF